MSNSVPPSDEQAHPAWESRSIARGANAGWSRLEIALFRFFGVYFFLQVLPLDGRFWRHLVDFDFSFRGIFYLARFAPRFFSDPDTFANWAVVAVLALVGAAVWGYLERDRKPLDYDKTYYALRVLVRYRLALGVLAYGFVKLFPLQAPEPSLSHLNTAYGDFTAWKLFSLSLGVVPGYQAFLGAVEILGGLLLLNRKTTVVGTLIILPFTGNVAFSNLAYEGGEAVYAFYLISLALFLFAYDGPRLFSLVSLEGWTQPARFRPQFTEAWQRNARLAFKIGFILLFVGVYGAQTYAAFRRGPALFPQTPGLALAAGLYNVSEFRVNGKAIPYSKTDSTRWQDVVFEKWNTISIRSNRPVWIDSTNTEEFPDDDEARNHEFAGAQGRHYYRYDLDRKAQVLTLKNRNPRHAGETLTLHYHQPNDSTFVLRGLNERRDSVYVVLNRLNKKYLVFEAQKTGRQRGLKL